MVFIKLTFSAEDIDTLEVIHTEEHYFGFNVDKMSDEDISSNWGVVTLFKAFKDEFEPDMTECYFDFERLDANAYLRGEVIPENAETKIVSDLTLETETNS